jgi:DNA-binding beta-propeller fold protein YncE
MRFRLSLLFVCASWGLAGGEVAHAADGEIEPAQCITTDSNVAAANTVGTNACLGLATVGVDGLATGFDNTVGSIATSPDGLSVYVTSTDDDALARFARNPDGTLTYKGCITGKTAIVGINGCVAAPKGTTASGAATAFDQPGAIAVSPDGDSVYVGSAADSAVVVFDRAGDGALTYVECLSSATAVNTAAECDVAGEISAGGDDTGFGVPSGLAVAPDGDSVYAVSFVDASVTHLERESDGSLNWKGCVSSDSGFNTANTLVICQGLATLKAEGDDTGLHQLTAVAVSPDGDSVYATSAGDHSVVRLDRAANGALTYQGCLTGDSDVAAASAIGVNSCAGAVTVSKEADDTGLDNLRSVVVSPNDGHVYAASQDDSAVLHFTRAPGGAISYADCVTGNAAVAPPATTGLNGCTGVATDAGLGGARSLAIDPDGDSVYVAAGSADAVAHLETNATHSLDHAGCVTGNSTIAPAETLTASGCLGLATTVASGAETGYDNLRSVVVSADGDSVYALSASDAAVIGLDRENPPPPVFDPPGDPTPTPTPVVLGPPADTTPPETTLTGKVPKKLTTKRAKATLILAFTSSEAGSRFECSVGSKPFTPCTSPFRQKLKAKAGKGRRPTISVVAIDAAGNRDPSPATVQVRAVRRRK